MKTRQMFAFVLVGTLAAAAGYSARVAPTGHQTQSSLGLKCYPTDPACSSSFCELENAKAVLADLADQFLTDAYSLRAAHNQAIPPTEGDAPARRAKIFAEYVHELQSGVDQLKGTDLELRVTVRLLMALKGAKLYDRWLDVYLDALYRHPTSEVMGRFAVEAVSMSRAAGRQDAVREAFWHVRSIPATFAAKTQLEVAATLLDADTRLAVTPSHF